MKSLVFEDDVEGMNDTGAGARREDEGVGAARIDSHVA